MAHSGCRICEVQADTIARRYPHIRIASLRLSWTIPSRSYAMHLESKQDPSLKKNDLWGYTQEDSAADAFLLAIQQQEGSPRSGHDAFFIVAPEPRCEQEAEVLRQMYWGHVPVRGGGDFTGSTRFFDCGKAAKMLGWIHQEHLCDHNPRSTA